MIRRSAAPWSLALVTGLATAAAAQSYTAVPLGTLGGQNAAAFGINEANWVVGWSDTLSGASHAFVHEGEAMIDLGTLTGDVASVAYSINNQNQAVGYSIDASDNEHAVMWTRDALGVWHITSLGALPGGLWSIAEGINDSGQVVGWSARASGPYNAFLREANGTMIDLGALDYPPNLGHSVATGISNTGIVVGYAYAPLFGPEHGFTHDGRSTDITPLGQFGLAHPTDINNNGIVVGYYSDPAAQVTGFNAGRFTPGVGWQLIGALPGHTDSYGYDINSAGDAVGVSFDPANQDFRGFAHLGGALFDLNAISTGFLGQIIEAQQINDTGRIAASGQLFDSTVALLLVPGATCGSADFNGDGDTGTDADIEAFFACLGGTCCATCGSADFNGDGDTGTDADIEAFFRVLGGGTC